MSCLTIPPKHIGLFPPLKGRTSPTSTSSSSPPSSPTSRLSPLLLPITSEYIGLDSIAIQPKSPRAPRGHRGPRGPRGPLAPLAPRGPLAPLSLKKKKKKKKKNEENELKEFIHTVNNPEDDSPHPSYSPQDVYTDVKNELKECTVNNPEDDYDSDPDIYTDYGSSDSEQE